MGYYYTADPENAVPPKFWVPPKTHGPGSPLKERGHRFYQPEVGRWASRDPIEEEGGYHLYCLAGNNAIDYVDEFGLFNSQKVDGLLELLEATLKRVSEITFDPNGTAVSQMKAYLKEEANNEVANTVKMIRSKDGFSSSHASLALLMKFNGDAAFGGKFFKAEFKKLSLLNYNAWTVGNNAMKNHKINYRAEIDICDDGYSGQVIGSGEIHDVWDFHPDNTGSGWKSKTYNLLARTFGWFSGFYWFWGASDVKTHMYFDDSWEIKSP